ncbi:MAG: arginase family protein [Sporolactobacillus sp.]
MSERSVVFFNFDHCYRYQDKLTHLTTAHWIDLSSLRGTNLYCSPEAFSAITQAAANVPSSALHFLGSGNCHYVTLAMLQKLRHPFTLLLFDHHTDLNRGCIGDYLSCGSWVQHALRCLPLLKRAIIIGPEWEAVRHVPADVRCRTFILPERRARGADSLLAAISTDSVYISIDKDILSRQDARTNWDQGCMKLSTLCRLLSRLLLYYPAAGVDVCGELCPRPHEQFTGAVRMALALNERANLALCRCYLECRNRQIPKPSL